MPTIMAREFVGHTTYVYEAYDIRAKIYDKLLSQVVEPLSKLATTIVTAYIYEEYDVSGDRHIFTLVVQHTH